MYRLSIASRGITHTLEFQEKVLLSDAIREVGIEFDFPCSGNGTCGKCCVTATGMLSPPDKKERTFNLGQKMRLACQTWAIGDAQVFLPHKILDENIFTDGVIAPFEPTETINGFGIAVDIGTTTIVSGIFKPGIPRPIFVVSERNNQRIFGADVISRISYSMENGVSRLQETIKKQLDDMFAALIKHLKLEYQSVAKIVITGNTTMLHLLNRLDPKTLSFSPFETLSNFGCSVPANRLFSFFNENTEIYFPPCISAYIGADITCSILASSLQSNIDNALLVDIGTNGEMAYSANGKIVCCSCAAGPAFEGAGLSMGMTASAGAVSDIVINNTTVEYKTISDEKPSGICGSGVIAGVAEMLRAGILDSSGKIKGEGHSFPSLITNRNEQPAFLIGSSNIVITQQDIRSIQLAKSAIAAGIDALLHECKASPATVDRFVLCGGFGSSLNKAQAAAIGLYPDDFIEKTQVAGNAAFSGAASLLFSKTAREQAVAITKMATELSLSSNSFFMNRYIEKMSFEEVL